MKLNKYLVYMDDGHAVFKIAMPATSEKAARKAVEGNGEIIAVKDASEYLDGMPALDCLAETLQRNHYGEVERDLIIRALRQVGLFGDI